MESVLGIREAAAEQYDVELVQKLIYNYGALRCAVQYAILGE
jgi:hypothetical protein